MNTFNGWGDLGLWWASVLGVMASWTLIPDSLRAGGARISFLGSLRQLGRDRQALQRGVSLVRRLEDSLQAGTLPAAAEWRELERLPGQWGLTLAACVRESRAAGLPVLPTLARFRQFLADQDATLALARARSAQAIGQTLSCAVLVPVFAFALAVLLPGIAEARAEWLAACLIALAGTALGAAWIFRCVERARWMLLAPAEREWIMGAACAGERLLALIRAGHPPDIAWASTLEAMAGHAPALVQAWGAQVWDPAAPAAGSPGARAQLLGLGPTLRQAIQVSLMEGKPCVERIEAVLRSLRAGLAACLEHELGRLPTQALKPLFVCVAPSMLGLLATGVYLCWRQLAAEGF